MNRLWHYHFGPGSVDTPSDFGFGGGRPSHPELLDWLADEFAAGSGRSRRLHRLICRPRDLSAIVEADRRRRWRRTPQNRLLWR